MRASIVLLLCLAGCKSEPANDGKRIPRPPPASTPEIPSNLSIAVTVDGVGRDPITRATLARLSPDWSNAQHKAWRIARLVGVPESVERSFAVTGTANDITVELPAMSTANTLVPVLLLNQRGSLVAEFLDPQDPFPRFHGEGGRLGRSPEPEPRIIGVTKIDARRRAP